MSSVSLQIALEKSKVLFKVLLVESVNIRDRQIRHEAVAFKTLTQKPFLHSPPPKSQRKWNISICLSSDQKPGLMNRKQNPGFISFQNGIPNTLAIKLPFVQFLIFRVSNQENDKIMEKFSLSKRCLPEIFFTLQQEPTQSGDRIYARALTNACWAT